MPLGSDGKVDKQVAMGWRFLPCLILVATLSFCEGSVSTGAHGHSSIEVIGRDLALSLEPELLIPLGSSEWVSARLPSCLSGLWELFP